MEPKNSNLPDELLSEENTGDTYAEPLSNEKTEAKTIAFTKLSSILYEELNALDEELYRSVDGESPEDTDDSSLTDSDEPDDDEISGSESAFTDDTDDEEESEPDSIIPDEPYTDEAEPVIPENETRRVPVMSGPVSDDTPSSAYSDENEDDIYRTKRLSFSYRSAAKTEDRTNRVQNPEDNIRYVRKESGVSRNTADSRGTSRKKNYSEPPETKSDISSLDTGKKKPVSPLLEKLDELLSGLPELRRELFGSRNSAEKNHGLDVKSTPEVDYFSIDVDINEDEDEGTDESGGFFSRKGNSAGQQDSSIDDYNEPGDASLIQEELYSLKGSLTVKFFVQLAAVLASVYLSASALYSIPVPEFINNSVSPHRYSFAMFLISALALFSSFPMITGGIRNLFRKKADCDSLAAAAITISTIAAAVSTESPDMIQSGSIYIFTPVAVTAVLVNTLGKHLIVNRAINNFDMLISSETKHSLVYVDNEEKAAQITRGVIYDYPILAATRKTGFSKDFLRYTYSTDIADKLCRKFVPASLFVSVILTLLSIMICSRTMETLSFTFAFSMLSMFISVCACFGIPLVINLPLANAAAETEENESIILGYQSIDDFYDTNSLILDSGQIFPEQSVQLISLKMYSDTKIDDVLITAASLIKNSGSIFSGLFEQITDHNDELLEKVENFSCEDTLGLCGWIKNKRILFGTRQLMADHNIEGIPPKSREQEAAGRGLIPVYLSVSGNLAAVFTVKLTADSKVSEYLNELAGNGISLIIKTTDSIVTATRISRLFDIPEDMIRIVPSELREFCDEITSPAAETSSSVICSGTLASKAKAISNIRHIHHSSLTGLVLQSTSALLALFFVIIFMIIGSIGQITPLMIILYHTVWVFLTMFIMKVKPR